MNGFEVEGETWSERETEGHHGTYERERGEERPNAMATRAGTGRRTGGGRGRRSAILGRTSRGGRERSGTRIGGGRQKAHWIGMEDQTSMSELLRQRPCDSDSFRGHLDLLYVDCFCPCFLAFERSGESLYDREIERKTYQPNSRHKPTSRCG